MDRKVGLREITFGRKRRTPSPLQNLRFGPILVVGLGREREGERGARVGRGREEEEEERGGGGGPKG